MAGAGQRGDGLEAAPGDGFGSECTRRLASVFHSEMSTPGGTGKGQKRPSDFSALKQMTAHRAPELLLCGSQNLSFNRGCRPSHDVSGLLATVYAEAE